MHPPCRNKECPSISFAKSFTTAYLNSVTLSVPFRCALCSIQADPPVDLASNWSEHCETGCFYMSRPWDHHCVITCNSRLFSPYSYHVMFWLIKKAFAIQKYYVFTFNPRLSDWRQRVYMSWITHNCIFGFCIGTISHKCNCSVLMQLGKVQISGRIGET